MLRTIDFANVNGSLQALGFNKVGVPLLSLIEWLTFDLDECEETLVVVVMLVVEVLAVKVCVKIPACVEEQDIWRAVWIV